jgi:maltose/moltooligosaccharide transporter
MEKPRQGFWGLWNISFGFFGIQIGFALQNANASRIFQSLGTPVDELGLMWLAAPLTGLLVQPLIGHYSDRTWGKLGRRRPYFLAGAFLSTLALFFMPNSPAVWAAAITLWVLDASLNISMEPFRAFVGDMLSRAQRPSGYAFQTAFIGAGAVVASIAPYVFEHMGVANEAPMGVVPDTVQYGFYLGGALLLSAVLWTVFSTKEYSPDQMAQFADVDEVALRDSHEITALPNGPLWMAGGALAGLIAWAVSAPKEAYLIAGALIAFGIAKAVSRQLVQNGRGDNVLSHIISDLSTMPETMRRLSLAQFFTWGALIIMWVYTTPVVAQYAFGTADPASKAFNQAGNWVGVMFGYQNVISTLAAFALPVLASRIGAARTHVIALLVGAASYASYLFIHDKYLFLLPMTGIGIVWASILSMPYVILANALPQNKLGIYMGIFNFFIVLPQILVALLMGAAMKAFFPHAPVWTMLVAAGVMTVAALAMLRVETEGAKAFE